VVVAGTVAVEHLIDTILLPRQGEGGEEVHVAVGERSFAAGPAGTIAAAAAATGVAARVVGAVGEDPAGRACRDRLARAGVEVDTLRTVSGPTGQIVARYRPQVALPGSLNDGPGQTFVLPGAAAGVGAGEAEALEGCRSGDVLVIEWSSLSSFGWLVDAAYERDLQVLALLWPLPLLGPTAWTSSGSERNGLGRVDVAVVDPFGAAALGESGDGPRSLCTLVGREGLSWDGETFLAPPLGERVETSPAWSRASLTGALAAALARGDDRPEAAAAGLAAWAAAIRRHTPYPGSELEVAP